MGVHNAEYQYGTQQNCLFEHSTKGVQDFIHLVGTTHV